MDQDYPKNWIFGYSKLKKKRFLRHWKIIKEYIIQWFGKKNWENQSLTGLRPISLISARGISESRNLGFDYPIHSTLGFRLPDPSLKRYAITLVFLYAGSTRVPLPLLTWQTPPLILILLSTAKSIFRKKMEHHITHTRYFFFKFFSFHLDGK